MSAVCWLCENKECGGWGCGNGGMPILSPAELQSLDRPRVCITCESRLAEVGLGSNFCEVCNPDSSKYRRKLSEQEEADHEEADRLAFEHDHRWGAGPTQADVVLADYGGES